MLIIENIFRVCLSNAKLKGSAQVLLGEGSGKKLGMFLMKKRQLIIVNNSDMVKPERYGYLHLVYYFTVPLINI